MPAAIPPSRSKDGGSSLFPPWMESARAGRADVSAGAVSNAAAARPAGRQTPGRKVTKARRRGAELDPESSSCVEPDYLALLRSISAVLTRRIRDNDEHSHGQITHPLFCEDTHTEEPAEDIYQVQLPPLHLQVLPFPTLYTLKKLRPPPRPPPSYPVPPEQTVLDFIENIWHRARLTPQSLVICLVYVDRLEARSEGALLHARSWRPIIFASLLLASKVWHDVSYWNSDFSTICPMFTTRNINQMERSYLQLLQYNTIISASTYASYYFSLRTAAVSAPTAAAAATAGRGRAAASADNFRRKYLMTLNVPAPSKMEQQTMAIAGSLEKEKQGGAAAAAAAGGAAHQQGAGAGGARRSGGAGGEQTSKQVAIEQSHSWRHSTSCAASLEEVAASYVATDKPCAPRGRPDKSSEPQTLSMSLCSL